jgi:dimethylhistidine N-methyltransferase
MRDHGKSIAERIGPEAMLIEYGSGNSEKTRILLDRLVDAVAYAAIDISREHLLESAWKLAREYPSIEVMPVCADYDQRLDIPAPRRAPRRRVVYFPGSTIGNFHPEDAVGFLARMRRHAGPDGALLIGVDLKKDRAVLEAAYNDSASVTAAFNLNVLLRLNREIDADFDIEAFRHRAHYNEEAARIEMHLVSAVSQTVSIDGAAIDFAAGEPIWTESSYKYTVEEFSRLAARAGFELERVWIDDGDLFSVQYYRTD